MLLSVRVQCLGTFVVVTGGWELVLAHSRSGPDVLCKQLHKVHKAFPHSHVCGCFILMGNSFGET